MAIDVSTLISLAGALGLGTVVGQWTSGGKDRRTARAAALKALGDVERARWAQIGAHDHVEFRRVLRDFQTAALIGQLPRSVVETYSILTTAAHHMSVEDLEAHPEDKLAGGIDGYMADVVADVARLLTSAAWWSRTSMRWMWIRPRHKRLLARISGLGDVAQRQIKAAREATL